MGKHEKINIDELLIGTSAAVKRINRSVQKVAQQQKDVLIVGERGTGKSTVGQTIHQNSSSAGSIMTINPFAADEREIQKLTEASSENVSTILVREIEDFSYLHQALLAKFIKQRQDKKFIRLIITSKKNLKSLISSGKITDELSQLMSKFETIEVPPLNERAEDIPLLVEHFMTATCNALGVQTKTLDINTLHFLSNRLWPDNIRELKTVVEHSVLSSKGEVVQVPAYIFDEHTQLDGIINSIKDRKQFQFDNALASLERLLIERSLEMTGYNQTRAAHILGLSGPNFRYRLRKFRIRKNRN